MAPKQPNEIPGDYGVMFVFREFKQTLIHQWFMSIGSKDEFHCSMSTVPWREFFRSGIEMLYFHLRDGWPKPIPSAKWDHEKKRIELFADDLFLCPDCGNFYILEQDGLAGRQISALIHHPKKDIGSAHWMGLDPSDAYRLKAFAASRLNVPEFYMQPCKSQSCQQTKLRVIRKFKSESRRTKQQLPLETRVFLEAKPKPKPVPSYTSLVYLIHGSGHHKIGIALDANKRLKGIQTSCPFPVEIVKTWKSENAQAVERALHLCFAEHRLNGEWFKLPDCILTMLKGIEDIDAEFLTKN